MPFTLCYCRCECSVAVLYLLFSIFLSLLRVFLAPIFVFNFCNISLSPSLIFHSVSKQSTYQYLLDFFTYFLPWVFVMIFFFFGSSLVTGMGIRNMIFQPSWQNQTFEPLLLKVTEFHFNVSLAFYLLVIYLRMVPSPTFGTFKIRRDRLATACNQF